MYLREAIIFTNGQEFEPRLKFQLLVSMLLLASGVRLEKNPIAFLQEMAWHYLASCMCVHVFVCVCLCVRSGKPK